MKFKRVEKDILHGCYTRTEARPQWCIGPDPHPARFRSQAQAHSADFHCPAKVENPGGDRQSRPGRDWRLPTSQGSLLVQLVEMEETARPRPSGHIGAQETRLPACPSRSTARVRAGAGACPGAWEARSRREDDRCPKKTLLTVRIGPREEGRPELIEGVTQLSAWVGVSAGCDSLG